MPHVVVAGPIHVSGRALLDALDDVLLSPHIAGVTEGAAERMAIGSVRNALDFFAGSIGPAPVVNRK